MTFVARPTDLLAPIIDRRTDGRERRRDLPRSAHAEHHERTDRPDPVALLERQHADRLADLVPVRVGRMAQSPLAFLRGSAIVMTNDLAATPTTGLTVQACGDAHLGNFGGFASVERRDVFDLNDFDETLVGPWEWDLKRLAASASVAATDVGHGPGDARAVAAAAVRSYRDTMRTLAELRVLDLWYSQVEVEMLLPLLNRAAQRNTTAAIAKMRRRTADRYLPKITELTGSGRRLVEQPPFVTRSGLANADAELVARFVTTYIESLPPERRVLLQRFQVVDAVRKVVGVGSVGTRCFVVLLVTSDDEPLLLQVKEAPPSVLEEFCGAYPGSGGERVVTGQRSIQSAGDIFLGWVQGPDRAFYVRQLRDRKHSVDISTISITGLTTYLRLCGATLARAHARTGDAAAIAGYVGSGEVFVDAVTEWAMRYAEQTRSDHARLVQAIADGEIEAVADV